MYDVILNISFSSATQTKTHKYKPEYYRYFITTSVIHINYMYVNRRQIYT